MMMVVVVVITADASELVLFYVSAACFHLSCYVCRWENCGRSLRKSDIYSCLASEATSAGVCVRWQRQIWPRERLGDCETVWCWQSRNRHFLFTFSHLTYTSDACSRNSYKSFV